MTDHRRHNRAPLRRSTTPQKILTSALAAATCVGIVGIIGIRTIDGNAAASAETSAVAVSAPTAAPAAAPAAAVTTSAGGLTREQLDTYAASLAAEKVRLDAYRAKLIKTAHRLASLAEAAGRASTKSS